jgi:hypothetical protein
LKFGEILFIQLAEFENAQTPDRKGGEGEGDIYRSSKTRNSVPASFGRESSCVAAESRAINDIGEGG